MRYATVCSGIEAPSVAWGPLGWEPVFFSEIDRRPCAVLDHHYPGVPNLGDFTTIEASPGPIDLLAGGTPCQDFSVAGLRAGLGGDRGNLTLEFLRLADRLRPEWLVWENVPGVLSVDGGRAFGAFLGGLVQLGYGFAWRVLDAQYVRVDGYARAVPQRRRRVFVVGRAGDWRSPVAVLLEREGMSGHPAPRRGPGVGVAGTLAPGAKPGGLNGQDANRGHLIAGYQDSGSSTWREGIGPLATSDDNGTNQVVASFNWQAAGNQTNLGFDASGTVNTLSANTTQAIAYGIGSDALDRSGEGAGGTAAERSGLNITEGYQPTLRCRPNNSVAYGWTVRRLMPVECERLQGFPDGYTAVPYRGGTMPDGPRYFCLGNSIAVNCLRWIGLRIELVRRLTAVA